MIKFGLLLIAYVAVTTAAPPCPCTRNLSPVCGSDGTTYANECLLNCARKQNNEIQYVKYGSCDGTAPESECICPFNYAPVCGNNFVTYPNECSLRCQARLRPGLELESRGVCQREEVKVADLPTCSCTRELKSVCGSNGITYANPCLLNCDAMRNANSVHVEHLGRCDDSQVKVVEQPDDLKVKVVEQPDDYVHVVDQAVNAPSCTCTREMQPVCGADGVTYNNQCLLKCAGTSLVNFAPC